MKACAWVLALAAVGAAQDPAAPQDRRVDLYGDPLPEEALARMGTVRLRHGGAVNCVAFSPDGRTLASGSNDHTVRVWEIATGKQILKLEGHTDSVDSVAFSPDGKTLASGSEDRTVRLWEAATGKEIRKLEGHANEVWSIAFSPDGRALAFTSGDTTVLEWSLAPPGWSSEKSGGRELEMLWEDLVEADPARPHYAVWSLGARDDKAVRFIRGKIRTVSEQGFSRLLDELGEDNMEVREKATLELVEAVGIERRLREALKGELSPEVRSRIERVLRRSEAILRAGEPLRWTRAVQALERIGTEEAQKVLEEIGTTDAQEALKRLRR